MTKIRLSNHPMVDGTIPELYIRESQRWSPRGIQFVTEISDGGETSRWLYGINAPFETGQITVRLDGVSEGDVSPAQTQKILGAMANLVVAVSEVGYEMATQRHEGGEG
jgi:hypothetical protein